MRIVVLGGGVIGVTSAYFLAKDGHEVEVVERRYQTGEEASAANTGLVAPGHSFAWASPKAPGVLAKSLVSQHTALRLRPIRAGAAVIPWGLKFLRNCTNERARSNTLTKLRLAVYSQEVLDQLNDAENLSYDQYKRGILFLFRDRTRLDGASDHWQIISDNGREMALLDRSECVALEPSLGPVQQKIAGGIYSRNDESGDCRLFTQELARRCQDLGVKFRYGEVAERLISRARRLESVQTTNGFLTGDAYVLAMGAWSAALARTAGLRVSVYPVKGYAVTFPTIPGGGSPSVPGVDEDMLVAWAPYGNDRLRLTGTAEFCGFDASKPRDAYSTIIRTARDLMPDGVDYKNPSFSYGFRPMTPDGPPIIGRTPIDGLFLNTGQGHMGWTMACGSARILRDQVAGEPSEIPVEGIVRWP